MSKKICILGFYVTCVLTLVCIPGSYSSGNCPLLTLTNGHTKLSGAGRIVRFFCNRPYILVGSNSAFCSHGEWNRPPPFCGSNNCSSLGRILHGVVSFSNRGAVATPTCDPDFTLIGSPSLICTENGWNDTLPVCQANSLLQFNTCHFEPKESEQCNWILKPALFKWTVMSSDEHNISDVGYYPGFDHTLGPHSGGHYLYLKNAMPVSSISLRLEQRPDNGAKYVSPLFPGIEGNDEWCLIFFIYSFGPNAGNVKVTINNDTVWENVESLRRNMWTKVTITLIHERDPFRITIIGKGNLGQFSNTAIDDLRIAHGADCLDNSDKILPYSVEPGFEEKELTTVKTEDTESHEIHKRETTTEVSSSTSTSASTDVDLSSSTSEKKSQQNSEPTTSTSDSINLSAQTSTSTNYSLSSSISSNFSYSPAVHSSTNETVIFSTTSAVSEHENLEISSFNTSTYDYQSTESSLHTTDSLTLDSSTIDSSLPANFHPIYDSKPASGMSVKSANVAGWSDLEKSMLYLSLVVATTMILIVTLVIIRYRNYHSIRMSNKKVLYNNENVAFLNGVELLDKY